MIEIYIRKAEGKLSDQAHQLLQDILQEKFGIENAVLRYSEAGKPYLSSGPYIGLSHSRGWVAVGIGDVPFGVDLEPANRKIAGGLEKRVLSPKEFIWYRQQAQPVEAFLTLWTLKESYYKYLGIGLSGFPNQTEFLFDRRWRLGQSACRFDTLRTEALHIAVCSYSEQSVRYHVF